jgi:hypothetical protein
MSIGLAKENPPDNVNTLYECLSVLKGKGMAKTFWLTGKDGFNKPLPEPPPLDR